MDNMMSVGTSSFTSVRSDSELTLPTKFQLVSPFGGEPLTLYWDPNNPPVNTAAIWIKVIHRCQQKVPSLRDTFLNHTDKDGNDRPVSLVLPSAEKEPDPSDTTDDDIMGTPKERYHRKFKCRKISNTSTPNAAPARRKTKELIAPPSLKMSIPPLRLSNKVSLLPQEEATPSQAQISSQQAKNEEFPLSADSEVVPSFTPILMPPTLPTWSGMFYGEWRWCSNRRNPAYRRTWAQRYQENSENS